MNKRTVFKSLLLIVAVIGLTACDSVPEECKVIQKEIEEADSSAAYWREDAYAEKGSYYWNSYQAYVSKAEMLRIDLERCKKGTR